MPENCGFNREGRDSTTEPEINITQQLQLRQLQLRQSGCFLGREPAILGASNGLPKLNSHVG